MLSYEVMSLTLDFFHTFEKNTMILEFTKTCFLPGTLSDNTKKPCFPGQVYIFYSWKLASWKSKNQQLQLSLEKVKRLKVLNIFPYLKFVSEEPDLVPWKNFS